MTDTKPEPDQKNRAAARHRWKNVPCPGCACVCDDITLSRSEDGDLTFEPNCELGRAWFETHAKTPDTVAQISGAPVELADAITRAVQILNNASYPLIYGLSRSSTPGQRAAVQLAEQLRGVVDTTASLCHGPSIMAIQEVGEVTSTLGEVRNRADLVVFWGCHPGQSHPRHAERYSVFPQGKFVRNGRSDRRIVVVGAADQVHEWRLDAQNSPPDLVVPIKPGRDFEAVAQLRSLLKGSCCDNTSAELMQLMQMMQSCRYGVVFF